MRSSGVILILACFACGETTVTKPPVSEPTAPATAPSAPAETASARAVEARPAPLFDRDACRSERPSRQPAVIISEIQRLEKERSTASPASRGALLRRLGAAYGELERAEAAKPEVQTAARKKAIESYSEIERAGAADDEVLHCLAYEYELASSPKNARSVYYDLIKKHPTSKYVPYAYLAFGELFFDEASKDPSKLDLAEQAYTEAAKYDGTGNALGAYAWLRLGQVLQKKGDTTKATDAFRKAAESAGRSHAPGADRVAEAARKELGPAGPAPVTAKASDTAARPAKVVAVDVMDVNEPQSAKVHVGDTLEVSVPLWPGTEWKIVGDQPTSTDFLQSWLGPNTHGMKYTFKIAGSAGKRTIKFLGTDANLPKEAPQVATVDVTVE